MPYNKQQSERLIELLASIREKEEYGIEAPTYKDSPALREIVEITLSVNDCEVDTLEDKIAVLCYVADSYDRMRRPAVSAKYYKMILEAFAELKKKKDPEEEEAAELENSFYMCIKTRNYYGENDACEDILKIVDGIIDESKIKELFESAKEDLKWNIKTDPVEGTEEYLAVIDEVEAFVDENKEIDLCYETWALKGQALAKRGIRWRSPALLNPGVMFD